MMTDGSQHQGRQPGDGYQFHPIVYPGPPPIFGNSFLPRSRTTDNVMSASTTSVNMPYGFAVATSTNLLAPPDPMNRWICGTNKDEPWSVSRSTASLSTPIVDSSYRTPRGTMSSDTESVFTSATPATTYSVHSEDFTLSKENLNIQGEFAGMQMQDVRGGIQASSTLQLPGPNFASGPCHVCGVTSRTPSEFKKHRLKHEKPFRCHILTCERSRGGFTTSNDLDRHKLSVHQIWPESGEVKLYKCASAHCKDKIKVWSRLDNFNQHLERIHPREEKDTLVERSEFIRRRGEDHLNSQAQVLDNHLDNTRTTVMQDDFGLAMTGQCFDPIDPMVSSGFMSQTLNQTYANLASYNDAFNDEEAFAIAEPQDATDTACDTELDFPQVAGVGSGHTSFDAGMRRTSSFHQLAGSSIHPEVQVFISMAEAQGCDLKALADAIYMRLAGDIGSFKPSQPENHGARTVADTETSSLLSEEEHVSEMSIHHATPMYGTYFQTASTITPVSQRPDATGNRCRFCEKVVPRPSALRKHEKRHKRLYGCTFTTCKRSFGTKDDWKRHENTQHFRCETWRCAESSGSSNVSTAYDTPDNSSINGESIRPCGKEFHRKEIFAEHLKRGNYPNAFWCGFCGRKQALVDCSPKAWDDRFNHIGEHFTSGHRIQDWRPEHKDEGSAQLLEDEMVRRGQSDGRTGEYMSGTMGGLKGGPSKESARIIPETPSKVVSTPDGTYGCIDPAMLTSKTPRSNRSLSLNKREREHTEQPGTFAPSSFPAAAQPDVFGIDSSYTSGQELMCGESGCQHELCRGRRGESSWNKRLRNSRGGFTSHESRRA